MQFKYNHYTTHYVFQDQVSLMIINIPPTLQWIKLYMVCVLMNASWLICDLVSDPHCHLIGWENNWVMLHQIVLVDAKKCNYFFGLYHWFRYLLWLAKWNLCCCFIGCSPWSLIGCFEMKIIWVLFACSFHCYRHNFIYRPNIDQVLKVLFTYFLNSILKNDPAQLNQLMKSYMSGHFLCSLQKILSL